MSLGRRRFLTSVSAGSAAYLAGCAPPGPGITPSPDGGTPCPTPTPFTPPALDFPASDYFDRLSMSIDAAGIGTPIVVVDLDRMEANVDRIRGGIEGDVPPPPGTRPDKVFRVVEKSLPSIDLLRLVTERAGQAGAERFLVLHLPLLPALLEAFPSADVISGKTHLTSAVAAFFDGLPAGTDRAAVARQVVFLADGVERLMELGMLADRLAAVSAGLRLRVAVEIDVGLRRSGVRTPDQLAAVLALVADGSAGAIELAGLLGYDGHVVHGPGASTEAAHEAWIEATAAFRDFVAVVASFPSLMRDDLIFHSGGTTTFPLYRSPPADASGTPFSTPVNDVATGGGVLRPGEYPDFLIGGLAPAIFVAAPVLRVYRPGEDLPEIPFLGADLSARVFGDLHGLTVYGGGWPAFFTHPRVGPAPLSGGGAGGCAWVPNQGLLSAAPELAIEPGDWIYFHPTSSDVIFQFDRIHTVRGGSLTGETLAAYPRRY